MAMLIHIVGCVGGREELMTLESARLIRSGKPIVLMDGCEELGKILELEGLEFLLLSKQGGKFNDLTEIMTLREKFEEIVLVVPQRPAVFLNENAFFKKPGLEVRAYVALGAEEASVVGTNTTLEDLINIIFKLRAPDGCPWDREQSHETLQTALLEETYEVLEAIQEKNYKMLEEELGDLLLQIAFHAVLAEEQNAFRHQDVVRGIIEKMVRRHPHVFSDAEAGDTEAVLRKWEELKREEKPERAKSAMAGLTKGMPGLLMADKMQRRAARVGFDWDDISQVRAKVMEEFKELQEAAEEDYLEETGDLLFAVVNLARFLGVDAEAAINFTNRKFKKRFQYIENRVELKQKSLQECSLAELDLYWEEAKALERRRI